MRGTDQEAQHWRKGIPGGNSRNHHKRGNDQQNFPETKHMRGTEGIHRKSSGTDGADHSRIQKAKGFQDREKMLHRALLAGHREGRCHIERIKNEKGSEVLNTQG